MKKTLGFMMIVLSLMTFSACTLFSPKPEGTFELVYHATDYFNRSSSKYSDQDRYDAYTITIEDDQFEEIKTIGESIETKSYVIKWGKNSTFTLQTTSFKTDVKDIIFYYDTDSGYIEQIKKDLNDTHIRVFSKDDTVKKQPPLGTYRLIHSEGQYQGVLITEDYFKEGSLNITEDYISVDYTYDTNQTYHSKTPYEASMFSMRLILEESYEVLIYDPKLKTLTFNFNASLGHSLNAYKLVFEYEK